MGDWGQIIVSLWFIPVVLFVIVPLFVGCLWFVYRMFEAFKPIAGQEKRPMKLKSHGEKSV